jgi:transposase
LVRSERAFCEELEYNLLFRGFLDMDPIESSCDLTVFTKNRERLLKHEVGQQLFHEVVGRAHPRGLLSDEQFTVDGTLIEAAASLTSFQPKDGAPPTVGKIRLAHASGADGRAHSRRRRQVVR